MSTDLPKASTPTGESPHELGGPQSLQVVIGWTADCVRVNYCEGVTRAVVVLLQQRRMPDVAHASLSVLDKQRHFPPKLKNDKGHQGCPEVQVNGLVIVSVVWLIRRRSGKRLEYPRREGTRTFQFPLVVGTVIGRSRGI